jgi:septum formation protein
MKILLSSTSPARYVLMQRTQLEFSTYAPNVDESLLEKEKVSDAVKRLAIAKAKTAAPSHPNTLIIGCDQLLQVNESILDKPHTHEKACKQLKLCSGQLLYSYTGICLYNSATQSLQAKVVTYLVQFKPLTDEMIERYLHLDQPYHCAGSIKAESLGFTLFESMTGDDPSALTGLPLITLNNFLTNEGEEILQPVRK